MISDANKFKAEFEKYQKEFSGGNSRDEDKLTEDMGKLKVEEPETGDGKDSTPSTAESNQTREEDKNTSKDQEPPENPSPQEAAESIKEATQVDS